MSTREFESKCVYESYTVAAFGSDPFLTSWYILFIYLSIYHCMISSPMCHKFEKGIYAQDWNNNEGITPSQPWVNKRRLSGRLSGENADRVQWPSANMNIRPFDTRMRARPRVIYLHGVFSILVRCAGLVLLYYYYSFIIYISVQDERNIRTELTLLLSLRGESVESRWVRMPTEYKGLTACTTRPQTQIQTIRPHVAYHHPIFGSCSFSWPCVIFSLFINLS